jgi:hypothetical protein
MTFAVFVCCFGCEKAVCVVVPLSVFLLQGLGVSFYISTLSKCVEQKTSFLQGYGVVEATFKIE